MCVVKELNESERMVIIVLNGGEKITSDWYEDKSEKVDNCVNRTEKEVSEYRKLCDESGISDDDVKMWFTSRKKDKTDIYISEHAFDRMKERCGLSRKAAFRHIKKVIDNGQDIGEVKGYLAPWARHKELTKKKGERFILYGDFVYVFNYETLVTVIHKPQKGKISHALDA
jgi:hypothetical protein